MLPHEHVFADLVREYRGTGLLNDEHLARRELEAFAAAGGTTLVDLTLDEIGRDPAALRRVAGAAGVTIIMGCGHYRDPYLDRAWFDRHTVDAIAEEMVRDVEEGVRDTGVRAGIIGEIGADRWYVSAAEERSFRAAARAHLRTGLTISTHAARWPVGLEQLRVALARALVLRPAVLLLDEPLGALDAKLRRQLQVELKQLQAHVGITFVYVTHDQEEALTMSDRIAVINHGRVEQAASPQDLYEEPANAFVADFLGVSNLMDASAVGPAGDASQVRLANGISVGVRRGDISRRGEVKVVIRPERILLEPAGAAGPNRIPGMVTNVVYLGSGIQLAVHLASGYTVTALVPNSDDGTASAWSPGLPVTCHLPANALRILGDGVAANEQRSGATA